MKNPSGMVAAIRPRVVLLFLALSPLHAQSLDRELLAAAGQGDVAAVEAWLAAGADPSFRRIGTTTESPETTALREAVRGSHADVTRLLLERQPDDRVVADAMPYLPSAENQAARATGRVFSEILLEQGHFELLAANADRLLNESALRTILEHAPLNDADVMLHAIQRFSWETVALAAAGFSPLPATAIDGDAISFSRSVLPAALVHRVASKLHEESRAVAMLQALRDRGVEFGASETDAREAAARATQFGLADLATALSNETDDGVAPITITDEDRLASAWLHRDMQTVDALRNAGVPLKGSALVNTSPPGPESLATVLVRTKKLDLIADAGISLNDWENPRDNPYRAATDLETVQWLLERDALIGADPEVLFQVLLAPEPSAEKIRMAEALIAAGADIHHTGGALGWTVLHSAVVHDGGDRIATIEMLLRHGADPDLPDDSGKSARDYAEDLFKIRLLEKLDPERKAGFWRNYGAPNAEPFAGLWSNGKDEFQTATIMLRENGEAQLFSSVSSSLAFWRIQDGKLTLDLIDVDPFPGLKREIKESITLDHPDGDPEILAWNHEGDTVVFKRVANSEMLEDALVEMNAPADDAPAAAPDADQRRRSGIESMMTGKSAISLTDWPDDELPQSFKNRSLTTLSLRGGNLKRLPDDMETRFPNLQFLVLERLPLEACPAGLDKLSGLRRLWMIDTGLDTLPDVRLDHLSELKLSGNRLPTIPPGWFASKTLYACDLSNNRLTQLPAGLLDHPGIQDINLSSNAISRLETGAWPLLQILDAKENHLREFSIGAADLPKLKSLNLDGNRLEVLPDALAGLPALVGISLSHNNFLEFPDVLDRMPALAYASLSSTRIPDDAFAERIEKPVRYRIQR